MERLLPNQETIRIVSNLQNYCPWNVTILLIISVEISFCFNCVCPNLYLSKIKSLPECLDIDQFIFYMPTKEIIITKHHGLLILNLKPFAIQLSMAQLHYPLWCQLATVILDLYPALSTGEDRVDQKMISVEVTCADTAACCDWFLGTYETRLPCQVLPADTDHRYLQGTDFSSSSL